MKTKRQSQSGNALIYVLIAIALFAALSLTLGRQTDTGEAGALSSEQTELLATQLINYATQVQSTIDQSTFIGDADTINELDFTLPTETGFNTADPALGFSHKVYHPEGVGLNPASLPVQAAMEISPLPPAGWYLGRFNDVEWTPSTEQDVILVAYQIDRGLCERINLKITGSITIPAVNGSDMRDIFIDGAKHPGTNADLTLANCADCENITSLCVSNPPATAYSFYTIAAGQ